jgi:hypothetical protein
VRDHPRNRRLRLSALGEVGLDRQGRASARLDITHELVKEALPTCHDGDSRAKPGEAPGSRIADAAAGALTPDRHLHCHR